MTQSASSSSFFRYAMLGLLVWGLFVALGAFLGPQFWSENVPQSETQITTTGEVATTSPAQALSRSFDYRKPVIVVVSVGIFVGVWGLLLYSRQKRLQRDANIDI